MNTILTLIIGIVIGALLVRGFGGGDKASSPLGSSSAPSEQTLQRTAQREQKGESLIQKQAREKVANKEAILGLFATQGGKLTNNHIQQYLGVSDAYPAN